MSDWIDGIEAARRAGWARAYQYEADTAQALALLVYCLEVLGNDGIRQRKVAHTADRLAQQIAFRQEHHTDRWQSEYGKGRAAARDAIGPRPQRLGWPLDDGVCR